MYFVTKDFVDRHGYTLLGAVIHGDRLSLVKVLLPVYTINRYISIHKLHFCKYFQVCFQYSCLKVVIKSHVHCFTIVMTTLKVYNYSQ